MSLQQVPARFPASSTSEPEHFPTYRGSALLGPKGHLKPAIASLNLDANRPISDHWIIAEEGGKALRVNGLAGGGERKGRGGLARVGVRSLRRTRALAFPARASPQRPRLQTLALRARRAKALPQGGLGRPPRADAGRPVTPCPHDGGPSLWGTYPFPTPFAAPATAGAFSHVAVRVPSRASNFLTVPGFFPLPRWLNLFGGEGGFEPYAA